MKKIVEETVKTVEDKNANWGHLPSALPFAECSQFASDSIHNLGRRNNIMGIVFHHTDTEQIEAARRVLKKKKLRTHILIDVDGAIYVEHPLDKMAAACVGLNRWMWQVDVVGRCEKSPPTGLQIQAIEQVIEILANGRQVKPFPNYLFRGAKRMTDGEFRALTCHLFSGAVKHLNDARAKCKTWFGVLDKAPFYVGWHGQVRPTRCCGKHLIPHVRKIVEKLEQVGIERLEQETNDSE